MIKDLDKKIKLLRKENGFSQARIAKELGMSRPTYMQVEKGGRELTILEAEKLASIFSMSLEEFLSANIPKKKISVALQKKGRKKAAGQEIRINVPQKNVAKFKEVLLYILEKVGSKPNVGETVLYKLLYFIDFDFYERHEEQLIGASYIKNYYGPTPVEFKKIVDDMQERGEIEIIKSKYYKHEQRKYLPIREPRLEVLSGREVKHIDEVLVRLSDKNAKELTNYSHKDVPWITTEDGKVIDYESVFYRTNETSVRDYGAGD